mgnify:CR=1 FL=1
MAPELKIFSGNSNVALAREISAYLKVSLAKAMVSTFSDGETRVKIEENVRGSDVFVIQSCCDPVNTSVMELLIMLDALKRSSAFRITAVLPYFGYARQDRKDQQHFLNFSTFFRLPQSTNHGQKLSSEQASPPTSRKLAS